MSSRRLRLFGALGAVIVALVLLLVFVLYGRIAGWAVRTKVVPKLEHKLGLPVDLGSMDIGRGAAVFEGVVIGGKEQPVAEVRRVEVEFDFWSSLGGRPEVLSVRVLEPNIRLRSDDERLRELLDRSGERDSGEEATSASSSGLMPGRLEVRGGSLRLEDVGTGAVLTSGSISADFTKGQEATLALADVKLDSTLTPELQAQAVLLRAEPSAPRESASLEVQGGRMELWPGMILTGIKGTASRKDEANLQIDFSGAYGGMDEVLWRANGSVDPASRLGAVDVDVKQLQLARLANVLEGTGVVEPADTTLGGNLHVELTPDGAQFVGAGHVESLNLFEPKLAEKPVRDISAKLDVRGSVIASERKLDLEHAAFTLGGVEYRLSGFLQLGQPSAPEDEPISKPRLSFQLVIPEVDCQAMIESIPPDFVPYMQGFKLRGNFSADVRLAIDWADLQQSVLDGGVGIRGCKVVKAPKELGADRLKKPFEHWVEVEGGKWFAFEVGPENPDFVPIDQISPHLINSIITTEDSRFFKHRGFIPREFRTAMIKDLEAGYFKYGASSITMQMVKNVILYREKTIARKFQELFFTWYLESALDKDRILEIYLNVIEYGPGLYGIGPATMEYFGKHPSELSPVEAAFFSSILPNPKRRYEQFCDGQLTRWTKGKIQRILQLMKKRDRLDEADYMLAAVTPLEFKIRDDISPKECKKRVKKFLEQKGSAESNPRKR